MSRVNPTAHRARRPALALLWVFGFLILCFLVHLDTGSEVVFSPAQLFQQLASGPVGGSINDIVWQIRLPQDLACVFAGGILGVVGSAFQAQLRNPLSEPYVIGVSSGAAVGGAIALSAGLAASSVFVKPAFGFVGGMIALVAVLSFARRNGVIARDSLILAGFVVGSFLSSVLMMVLLAAGQDTNKILQWLVGDVSYVEWPNVWVLGGTLCVGSAILFAESRRLNALAFGESTARQLGVNVNRLVAIVLATGTAMTAVTVGIVGVIGFVGLVAPHIARRVVGVDWRWSIPGSMLIGSLLLTCADIVDQRGLTLFTKVSGMVPPVGIVTAFVGAPVLLYLLKKRG